MEEPPQRFRFDFLSYRRGTLLMLVDQAMGLFEHGRFVVELANAVHANRGGVPVFGDQGKQFVLLFRRKSLQGKRPQHCGPPANGVAARRHLVVVVALPIVQVVYDLKRNAQVASELPDRLCVFVRRSRQTNARVHGGFERWGCLQGVDLQRVDRFQPFAARVAPHKLRPLPLGQSPVGLRQSVDNIHHHLRPQFPGFAAHQTIPHADHVVAHIDGGRRSVLAMHGLLAVAETVVVFDVVVDQRGLMERLDCCGDAFHRVGQLGHVFRAIRQHAFATGQGVVHGQCDEGPRILASFAQEVVSDGFGRGDRIQCSQPLTVDFR